MTFWHVLDHLKLDGCGFSLATFVLSDRLKTKISDHVKGKPKVVLLQTEMPYYRDLNAPKRIQHMPIHSYAKLYN